MTEGRCVAVGASERRGEAEHACDLHFRHVTRHFCACGRFFGPEGEGGIPPELRPVKGFDPAEIAAEAAARGEDPLAVVVGQLVGYASTCWERLNDAGTFESDRARAATEAVLGWLREQAPTARVGPGDRVLLIVNDLDEHTRQALAEWSDPERSGVNTLAFAPGAAQALVLPAGTEAEVLFRVREAEPVPAITEMQVSGRAEDHS